MVTKPITLNIWKENDSMLLLNQGEVDSRDIIVKFEDTDGNLELKDRQVTFYVQKPDGTTIFNNCSIDSTQNTASITVTSQMVSVAGISDCEFQIFDNNNSLLKVNGLKLMVKPNKDFSEAIESTSEFNVLTEAINSISKTVLYNNSNGSQGTITLSDVVNNYSYIEIFYRQDSIQYSSVKIDNPNEKNIIFDNVEYYSDKLYMRGAIAVLNESTLTWKSGNYGYKYINASGSIAGVATNLFFITKIVGYKS